MPSSTSCCEALAGGDAALLADAHVVGVVGAVGVLRERIPAVRGEQRVPVVDIAGLADLHGDAEALGGLAGGDELLALATASSSVAGQLGASALVGEQRDVLHAPTARRSTLPFAVTPATAASANLAALAPEVDRRKDAVLDEQADLVVRPFEDVRHVAGLIGLGERVLQLAGR